MGPMTRFRADDSHVPLPFVAEYYAQRASVPGTLLITEATFIAPQASGYDNVPGIWSAEQIAAWKKTTDAVHAKGSFIYMQLWALGRTARPDVLKRETDLDVKSASDLPFEGGPKPTPMTEEEIWDYVRLYKQAALNAVEAGFDGVEIHGANGYLIDQFLQDVSNNRTDSWGGSVEKRARFGLEVAKAVVDAVGAERTGIRLSPFSTFMGMKMADPKEQFSYFVGELKKLKLSYLHLVESRVAGYLDVEASETLDFLADLWGKTNPVFIAGGYNMDSAYAAVDEVHKDSNVAIVFGRWFTANPDLVFRLKNRLEFTPYDRNRFYNTKEEDGYTTWPFSKEFTRETVQIA
ncbi:MAG: hypothetical protein Q9195_005016 [Heterodermia aff. obscurata]